MSSRARALAETPAATWATTKRSRVAPAGYSDRPASDFEGPKVYSVLSGQVNRQSDRVFALFGVE